MTTFSQSRRLLSIFFNLFLTQSTTNIISAFSSSTTTTTTPPPIRISSKFKAPNPSTPPNLLQTWKTNDETLWSYVNTNVPSVLDHTGSEAFDVHLKGVQAVLRYWNAPSYLDKAGLFHSIYGTEGFQGFSLPLSERDVVKGLIGEKAERLCWVFCMVDRMTVDETVFAWKPSDNDDDERQYTFQSRPELGRFEIPLQSKSEWLDFLELTLADWLEQVEGASEKSSTLFLWKKGEAYAYRRLAYKRMSRILSHERHDRLNPVVERMRSEVMETEEEKTRDLIQERTPPMSVEAGKALEALRSAGMDITVDLSPRKMDVGEVEEYAEPLCLDE